MDLCANNQHLLIKLIDYNWCSYSYIIYELFFKDLYFIAVFALFVNSLL